MLKMSLTAEDREAVTALAGELAARFGTVESAEFQREARTYAEELPRRLRQAAHEFRLTESSGVFLLSGPAVDDERIGPTPAHWRDRPRTSPTLAHDLVFYLVACLLGEPIGWATQQDGRIMHDVFPIEEHTHEQIGWGSEELLAWHTEDAFHPMRTDYLGLLCLRNPDDVETTFADIADAELDEGTRELLFEERFYILPDNSHRPENQLGGDEADDGAARLRRRSRERVDRALADPTPVAVLFGSREAPYLRIDPYYMQYPHGVPERQALERVEAALDAVLTGAVLRPGDMCFLDNYRMVHGRKPFRARFDGTDRWLRRLNVARDLRKSRELRLTAESRVIF